MSVYNVPGVFLSEVDLSQVVPNFATTTGALVGYSAQGDVDNVRLITTSQQFIQEYGQPVPGQPFHYSALAFLSMGNALYCYRVQNVALHGGVAIKIAGGTNESFDTGLEHREYVDLSIYPDSLFYVFAKDPGAWNNSLGIRIKNVVGDPDVLVDAATDYTFDIEVTEKNSDGNYIVQESFKVSRKHKKDGYGRQIYMEDRINGFSKYIWVANNTGLADTVLPQPENGTLPLPMVGGTNGAAYTTGNVEAGWRNKFANKKDFPIRILINGGEVALDVQTAMKEIAESRMDCMAILDTPNLESASSIISWRTNDQTMNSSYAAVYAGWVKIYDQYNDQILECPPSGYIAAQYAYNDYVKAVFYAPAGLNRGNLNVIGLVNKFNDTEMGSMYEVQVNALASFPGEGFSIWGQKTLQTSDSALSRVNVRRLMLTIENAVESFLNRFIFEPNNEATRFRVTATIDEYMSKFAAAGAFQTEGGDRGYLIVCDTSNNTTSTIDSNELHVDIYVKPSRSAEFIIVQTVLTRTGASFNEIISRNFAV